MSAYKTKGVQHIIFFYYKPPVMVTAGPLLPRSLPPLPSLAHRRPSLPTDPRRRRRGIRSSDSPKAPSSPTPVPVLPQSLTRRSRYLPKLLLPSDTQRRTRSIGGPSHSHCPSSAPSHSTWAPSRSRCPSSAPPLPALRLCPAGLRMAGRQHREDRRKRLAPRLSAGTEAAGVEETG